MLNSPPSTPKNRTHAQKLRIVRPPGATINQPTYTSEPPKSTNVHKPPVSAKPPPNSMPPNSTATLDIPPQRGGMRYEPPVPSGDASQA